MFEYRFYRSRNVLRQGFEISCRCFAKFWYTLHRLLPNVQQLKTNRQLSFRVLQNVLFDIRVYRFVDMFQGLVKIKKNIKIKKKYTIIDIIHIIEFLWNYGVTRSQSTGSRAKMTIYFLSAGYVFVTQTHIASCYNNTGFVMAYYTKRLKNLRARRVPCVLRICKRNDSKSIS